MLTITDLTTELFETPLHRPFVTSQGATSVARAVAIHLHTENPEVFGYGESVPVQYVTGETIETVFETVEAIKAQIVGLEKTLPDILYHDIPDFSVGKPSARCGVEMALLDLISKQSVNSLVEMHGRKLREVESDLTIPIVANALELAERAWANGIRTFKLKVGGEGLEADTQRVLALAKAFPEALLRIDANQGFSVDEAVEFAERLVQARVSVQLLEQPVRADDFAGMVAVAERSPLPVFADESIKTPQDAERYAETPIAGYNCKINKSGIFGAKRIAELARHAGKKCMIGCMLETRYSIYHSLALACGTGLFDYIDLDSHLLLNEPGENTLFTQTGNLLKIQG